MAIINPDNTCDACSRATSYFTITTPKGGSFELCLHDFRLQEDALMLGGYSWEDRSHLLTPKPEPEMSES